MLTIYNTTVKVKDQDQADRLKQICIDYGLPIWDNPSAFIYNERYCYFRFQGSGFWISSYAFQQFNPLPEITEQQFIELLKNTRLTQSQPKL